MQIIVAVAVALAAVWGWGQADPFGVALESDDAAGVVEVRVTIPQDCYIYLDSYKVRFVSGVAEAAALAPEPPAVDHDDPFAEATVKVLRQSFTQRWRVSGLRPPVVAEIAYQGCNDKICFMPQRRLVSEAPAAAANAGADAGNAAAAGADGGTDAWLAGLREQGRVTGYLGPADFLGELDRLGGGGSAAAGGSGLSAFARDPGLFLKRHGFFWTFLVVLLGGLLLNLTPCVLPMIPVNLGIIGAASGGRRGFVLGLTYGAGIALVYGLMGVIAAVAGGVFGALQGSPYFNAGVAVVFLLLGMALFDVFTIDFSRLQGSGGQGGRGGLVAAAAAGGFAALLAGACVAPVVVAVLLLSASLYGRGIAAGALLPLGLGIGMALPWPFAGMGLSCLPRPGAWMETLKRFMGVFVVALAFYYGWVAWQGFRPAAAAGSIQAGDLEAWRREVVAARAAGKPLMVDFWATWCKNCDALERRTFRDAAVAERLKRYHVVRVQTERPEAQPARGMAGSFGVLGLPTIVFFTVTEDGHGH